MDYWDLDTGNKHATCQQRLTAWAGVLGGNVVTNTEDDEAELRTRAGDRAARFVVDRYRGTTELQLKLVNTRGILVLSWDPEKQPQDREHDPEWDSDGEQIMFLAPNLYIEEYPDEAKAMWELLGRMPPELVQEIVQSMPTRISYLKIDADKIELTLVPTIDQLPDPSAITWVFAMCDRIARYFESGSESVASKPMVYIGGKAANIANMASCPHCNTVIDLSEGSFCYNCGAPMKPKV